jgi:pimeloyl-ACP methyl ester carboxylesterase
VPKAHINGLNFHYQQMGKGRDMVMVHGLFANLAFWYFSVLPTLARHFRVTVYDLRGHGYSDMPPSGYTTNDMAVDLRAILDHLDVSRAHIVGHSFGGAVALHYAALYPERVASLTLADARVPSLQPAFPPRNARRWKVLNAKLRQHGIDVPEDLPRVAYSFFEELLRLQNRRTRRRKPQPPQQQARANNRPQKPASGSGSLNATATLLGRWNSNSLLAKRWSQLMRTTTAPEDLGAVSDLTIERIREVRVPTLAVFGQYSSCLPTLVGLEQNMANCKKVIIPRVGHFHPVIKPKSFVQNLRPFILGHKS